MPAEPGPPIWIHHFTGDLVYTSWDFVSFISHAQYELQDPFWVPLKQKDVDALAGQPVDPGRQLQ